jgi:hypothetical protein
MDMQELESNVGDYCGDCGYETCSDCTDCKLARFIAWLKNKELPNDANNNR